MRDFRERAGEFFRTPGAYIALALCIVTVGTVGYLVYETEKPIQQVTATAPIEEPEVQPEVVIERIPQPVEKPVVEIEPVEEVPVMVEDPVELLPDVVSPLDGTTVTVFSMTELMYDDTMADWRTHNGLDIQAGEGDAVKTAAAGTVSSITHDELMGVTVTIDHAGGYTTTYASLQEGVPVLAGQEVFAGDIIGNVGCTASAESDLGPHLHFSVSRDGLLIDPAEYVE